MIDSGGVCVDLLVLDVRSAAVLPVDRVSFVCGGNVDSPVCGHFGEEVELPGSTRVHDDRQRKVVVIVGGVNVDTGCGLFDLAETLSFFSSFFCLCKDRK